MQEIYQITSTLQTLPFCKHVAGLTDARFSGASTGACLGHISPEALAGGPIGRLRDGETIVEGIGVLETSCRAIGCSFSS
jgi:dihydroxyacid dehydratase/phosphogluconate dehydratase